MSPLDWYLWSTVYRAGAERARAWPMNSDMQNQAEVLEAQAERCEEIAREQTGNPAVTHGHLHLHPSAEPGEPGLEHRHSHEHAEGEASHAAHEHEPLPRFPGWDHP